MQALLEDYRVELDAYAGPLDLLLFLVKRHEIDLHDIPIARLTEQYLAHLKLLQQIDVGLAGEFLVMAATLLEIKSAMLLPRPEEAAAATEDAAADANPLDPRYELVQQLLAYKRFKDAAGALDQRREEWESRFARTPPRATQNRPTLAQLEAASEALEASEEAVEIDLDDVHVLDLCEAFARILDSIGQIQAAHQVTYDDTPIALHAEDILDRLQRDAPQGGMTLQQIFVGRQSRSEMIGLFLATLELVRQRRVRVLQDAPGGEIRLELGAEQERPEEERPADWKNPRTGEIEYDWPSEQARKAAERRAKLRAAYAAKRARGEETPDEEIIDVDGEDVAGRTSVQDGDAEAQATDDMSAAEDEPAPG